MCCFAASKANTTGFPLNLCPSQRTASLQSRKLTCSPAFQHLALQRVHAGYTGRSWPEGGRDWCIHQSLPVQRSKVKVTSQGHKSHMVELRPRCQHFLGGDGKKSFLTFPRTAARGEIIRGGTG